jgi:hypothetical protein
MIRGELTAALLVFALAAAAPAQAPRWRWQTGQALVYRVEQSTRTLEVASNATLETKTQLNLTKRWQVVAVDPSGGAMLQMSVPALRFETTAPGGEPLRYDSANPDKSTPALREQMARYVNQPLALLRVDAQGKVLEVKESKFFPASRFENELPFVGVLPAVALKAGLAWERPYQMTLAPPQGTGEKFAAVQRYTCKGVDKGLATMALTTELKSPPEAVADRTPLLQLQPEGTWVFDVANGRLRSATLTIDKELKGQQGEGSSYRYVSSYKEEYVER